MTTTMLTGGPYNGQIVDLDENGNGVVIDEPPYSVYSPAGEFAGYNKDYVAPHILPPNADQFTKIRLAKWEEIKNERDKRQMAGVQVGTNWMHSDLASRIQQIGLVMFGANMPPGIMWKTLAGTFIPMTPLLAQQIFAAQAQHDMVLFSVAEQKNTAMMALSDPTGYDTTTGWPPIYAG